MSGFLERVVADWLISADERGYQLAFVSCLFSERHTVKYVSSHTSLEHGKDIVSVAPDRKVHAYQLKAGSISKSAWRLIREEVRETAIVPVEIPGMRGRVPDRAFLVLTGHLSDPVRNEISLLNSDHRQRGYAEIEVIELPELVGLMTQAFENFYPQTLEPLNDLVGFYLRDGRGAQDNPTLSLILLSLLGGSVSPKKARRALSNVVVATQFAAAPYRKERNHIAQIDTWVIAACTIMLAAKENWVAKKQCQLPLELCWHAIESASDDLLAEVFSREDFLEGDNLLAESLLLGFRRLLVVGYVGAVINSRRILGENVKSESSQLLEIVKRERPMTFWGESGWNYLLNLALGIRHTPEGERTAEALVNIWVESMSPGKVPYPKDPYWTLVDELTQSLHPSKSPPTEQLRVSYTIIAAMGLLSRRMLRQHLNSLWAPVSRYDHACLVPDRVWSQLRWTCDEASLELRRMPIQGSWKSLREEAAHHRSSLFDETEVKFLPYFLCTFPHRVAPPLAGELDFQTAPASFRQEWHE